MNSSAMSLNEAIHVYLDYCQSKQLRPKTIKAYKQGLELFASWMNQETNIGDIKREAVRAYIVDLQNRGKYTVSACAREELNNCPENRTDYNKQVSNTTINNYIRYMRAFFIWLESEEYIDKSPMKRIKVLPDLRKPKEYLEDDEVHALFSVLDRERYTEYRDSLIMMLMLDSGTRLGETLSIEENQIDLKGRSLFLPAEKTKGKRARTVFFSRGTAAELKKWVRYKSKHCDSIYVFPIQKNGDAVNVSHYETNFKRYVKKAGIVKHISPHTLRNNFAKRCLLSGMDIYTLSRILGHSSVTVTERAYLDVKDIELKDRYQKHSPIKHIFGK